MADEWGSTGDYDQRKFANEEEEDAPDAWDVDEDAEKKRREDEEKAKAAAAAAAKAARDATKEKAPKKLTKKEERAQKEESDRKRKEAEEEDNDPAIKARRRKEQEEMARKRDNEFADGLFGGKAKKPEENADADDYHDEEGEDYEDGDYEEGEEDYAEAEEEEEEKTVEKPPPAAKASANTASKSAPATAASASKSAPAATTKATGTVVASKSSAASTTPAAAAAALKATVEKKEDLGYKVLDFKAAPVPARPVASPSSSASSSSASSSMDSMPLLSDEHFNSFAGQLSKKLRSLSPAVNTPSVHSARLVRFLRTVLQAAADVMTVDDVNEVKKSLMSIQQQKATAVKQAKVNPTASAATQKTATSRAAVGSNTLGRDIRATLNLKDDDDMFERNQATQAAARDAELEDFM